MFTDIQVNNTQGALFMVATTAKRKARPYEKEGKRLRELRESFSLSQEDLIEQLKQRGYPSTTQSHLSNLEQGFLLPRSSLALGLAKIFETNSAYILGEIDESGPLDEPEVDSLSKEAEDAARLVDDMPVHHRRLAVALLTTLARHENDETRLREERWSRLLAIVEGMAGIDVRKQVEGAAMNFALTQ